VQLWGRAEGESTAPQRARFATSPATDCVVEDGRSIGLASASNLRVAPAHQADLVAHTGLGWMSYCFAKRSRTSDPLTSSRMLDGPWNALAWTAPALRTN
jgi:hypothetical protein